MEKSISKIKNLWLGFKKIGLIKQLLIIGVLVGGVYLVYPKSGKADITYETETVKLGSVTQIIANTGEIVSTDKADVASTINGIVAELYVSNGDSVKKDQALYKVTSTATAEERAKAYALYISAKNSLETAKTTKYTLESGMWQANSTFIHDAVDLDKAETSTEYIQTNREWLAAQKKYLDQDQAIAGAAASVTSAWYAYQATIDGVVKAPIAGTVANLSVAEGQKVSTANPSLMISTKQAIWSKIAVSEADVKFIAPEQKAVIAIDALEGKSFAGLVKRVDEFGTDTSGVITYNVYLVLTETDKAIKPGMTTQVEITTEKKENVLLVSNAAIKPYQGSKAVQIMSRQTGAAVYAPVVTGIKGEEQTEIISGLTEGQEVVVSQTGGAATDSSGGSGGGLFGGQGR